MIVDNPFYGLFSIARKRKIKSLCWCGEYLDSELLPNGWRIFRFVPTISDQLWLIPVPRHRGGFF